MSYLELEFQLRGKTLPADHGYSMYAAIKKAVFEGKELPEEVLLSTIAGVPDREGMIFLTPRSRLRLRCPADQVSTWYRGLQNVVLDIRGHMVRVIQPRMSLPQASSTLRSRLVTFKLKDWNSHTIPQYFEESCQRALEALGICGQAHIDTGPDGNLALRSLQIRHKNILGFGVCVMGLSEGDSIALQCHGLGGRKHFGCGWFYPIKEKSDDA